MSSSENPSISLPCRLSSALVFSTEIKSAFLSHWSNMDSRSTCGRQSLPEHENRKRRVSSWQSEPLSRQETSGYVRHIVSLDIMSSVSDRVCIKVVDQSFRMPPGFSALFDSLSQSGQLGAILMQFRLYDGVRSTCRSSAMHLSWRVRDWTDEPSAPTGRQ